MRLQEEQYSPLFDLKDVFGRQIDLRDYKGRKVLIAFFRHAACPFCSLRVFELTKAYEELKAQGLDMIFFFESKERVLLRSSFHKDISPVPLISDPEKTWYNTFGLETSVAKMALSALSSGVKATKQAKSIGAPSGSSEGASNFTMPAEFLLDENLMIQKAHYANRLKDRIPLEEIKAFAKSGKILA